MKEKDPKKVKRGKKSKAHGNAFELKTRKDLESKGFICSKWQNNVETELYKQPLPLEDWKLVPAKPKMVFNPAIKRMIPQGMSSGFPDFIAFKRIRVIDDAKFHGVSLTSRGIEPEMEIKKCHYDYDVIGVESKLTGTLDRIEKQKCKWLIDKGIFSKILISKKTKVKNKIVVEYIDFVDIEKRMK